MRIGRTRIRSGPDLGPDNSDAPMVSVSADEARAAVAEAVEERRARPALKAPLGFSRNETTSGLALSLLAHTGGAAATAVGLAQAWSAVPHDIRATRYHLRDARINRRVAKASEWSQSGAGDVKRISAFRRAIIEGSVHPAALGVCMLFRELAGDQVLAEEIIQRQSPAWPAWCYRLAMSADMSGDVELAREHREQAFATAHPVWATAAAIGLLNGLQQTRDAERVASLTGWIARCGDSAVVIESLFYGH